MYLMDETATRKEQFVATEPGSSVVNIAKLPIYAAHRLFTPASLLFDATMVLPVICGASSACGSCTAFHNASSTG